MRASVNLAAEYSAKARAYADWWAPVLRPMAQPLLAALPLAPARRIVDVGTGTGALLADIMTAAPGACVVGVDRALGMLRVARASHPTLAVMDIADLALQPEQIDVAIAAFMLFHVPDPVAGVAAVLRILRPGGTLGVVTWGHDPGTPGMAIWTEELDRAGAAPDPRDPSVMQQATMDTPDKLRRLLGRAGFTVARIWRSTFHQQWTVETLLPLQIGCGLPARRLPSLPAEARGACIERVRARLAMLPDAEWARVPETLSAVAVRPATRGTSQSDASPERDRRSARAAVD